jgi:hypothetical protein
MNRSFSVMKVKTFNIPQIMLIFLDFQKSSTQMNRHTPCVAMSLAFPFRHYLTKMIEKYGQNSFSAVDHSILGQPSRFISL